MFQCQLSCHAGSIVAQTHPIVLKILPIILKLCLMLWYPYYFQNNYAGMLFPQPLDMYLTHMVSVVYITPLIKGVTILFDGAMIGLP